MKSSNTRIINYEATHIRTGDKQKFTADENECAFCKAAHLFGLLKPGDFIFILLNSDDIPADKDHVHEVTYHGMARGIRLTTDQTFEQPLYSCEHSTLEHALNYIRKNRVLN